MRTLKKALSLVLVLAMVFTLAVPALAVDKSSDFTDYDKVTNKEAVDVLTALGVLNGNTDGTFGPEGTFTRAQAASIIAHMMLGSGADALTKVATGFSDVPADHWASGYIQFCVSKGILNGYGNGKFGPDDKLTATQWSLMLLGALGYNAKNEGIGGNGWEIATTTLAIQAGVATADELTATFNRDMAAKLAFNTLKATMVQYSSGVNVSTGDTNITVNATRSKVEHDKTSGYKAADNDEYTQFCEQYFGKLRLTSVSADEFGHPASQWSFKGTTVGTYADSSNLVVTYTAGTKNSTVTSDLKGYTFAAKKNAVYVDGKAEDTTDVASTIDTVAEVADLTGNGRVVEVYATEKKIDRIVVTNAVLAQVTKVNTKAETVTYKTVVGGGTTTYTSSTGYGHVAEKDYVMINLKATTINVAAGTSSTWTANTVLAVAPATVVTGAITATTNGKDITVDGTKYTQSVSYNSTIEVTSAEQDVYLDTFGYVVYTTANTDAGNYMVVTKAAWATTDELGYPVYKVQGVLADGTVGTYVVEGGSEGNPAAGLYSYTVSNGKYTLKAANATTSAANYGHKATATSIAKGEVKLGNHYFANDVTFVSVSNAGQSSAKATVYTGKQVVSGTAEIYYLTGKSVNDNTAGTITTVFVIGGSVATSNEDLVFATSTSATGKTTINGTNYDTYTVYVNGEKKSVPATGAPSGANEFCTYTVDSNGVYTFNKATTGGIVESKTISAYENFVKIDTKDYTATDDIVVIDTRETDDPIESVSAIAAATGTITASAVVNNNDSTVSMIYITNVA